MATAAAWSARQACVTPTALVAAARARSAPLVCSAKDLAAALVPRARQARSAAEVQRTARRVRLEHTTTTTAPQPRASRARATRSKTSPVGRHATCARSGPEPTGHQGPRIRRPSDQIRQSYANMCPKNT